MCFCIDFGRYSDGGSCDVAGNILVLEEERGNKDMEKGRKTQDEVGGTWWRHRGVEEGSKKIPINEAVKMVYVFGRRESHGEEKIHDQYFSYGWRHLRCSLQLMLHNVVISGEDKKEEKLHFILFFKKYFKANKKATHGLFSTK